jgi:hypothetical protein
MLVIDFAAMVAFCRRLERTPVDWVLIQYCWAQPVAIR